MSPSPTPKIRSRQIADSDLDAMATLLTKGFPDHNRQFWLRAFARLRNHSTPAGYPKFGYLLECGGVPVGVILLIFSKVPSGAGCTTRCNVSSWYVEPEFRCYASALVSQALKVKNVTYLNITAAPHTRTTVEAQGYSRYSNGVFVAVPLLNSLSKDTRAKVLSAQTCQDADLDPVEQNLLLEHAACGCICLWCMTSDHAYPFVFRPRVIKGFIACTQLIYCCDIEVFVRFAQPIGKFLAMRGRPLVIIDSNGAIPGLVGKYLDGRMPKYFKGPDRPRLGDLAYTEAALFGV
jgi:hypothetical protein